MPHGPPSLVWRVERRARACRVGPGARACRVDRSPGMSPRPSRGRPTAEALPSTAGLPISPGPPPPPPPPAASSSVVDRAVLGHSGALGEGASSAVGSDVGVDHRTAEDRLIGVRGLGLTPLRVDEVLTVHRRRVIVGLCLGRGRLLRLPHCRRCRLVSRVCYSGNLAAAGVVIAQPTAGSTGDGALDVEFMRRVLVGLLRL